jgi:hypothetical protein
MNEWNVSSYAKDCIASVNVLFIAASKDTVVLGENYVSLKRHVP